MSADDRYGTQPHEYFAEHVTVNREQKWNLQMTVLNCRHVLKKMFEDKDSIKTLRDEFLLKTLPQH